MQRPPTTPRSRSLIQKIINKYVDMSSSAYRRLHTDSESDQFELDSSDLVEIQVFMYNIDGLAEIIPVTSRMTSEQICLGLSNRFYRDGITRAIVEVWKDEGIERILEFHETLLSCHIKMLPENSRIFVYRQCNKLFDIYEHPEAYPFYNTLDHDAKNEAKIIQKVLNGDIDPLHHGQVWIYDCNKINPFWEIKILLLKDKIIYLSLNNQNVQTFLKLSKNAHYRNTKLNRRIQDKCQVTTWAYLNNTSIYTVTKVLRAAPTEHCLCLVSDSGLSAKQYIACTSKKSLSYWMCAMRLSKYGKQLRDNYRSFVKKHNDGNEYEYNKKPLPNESTRSHVAMDFTGNVGRIVEDPKEAMAIAKEPTSGLRRSWRSSGRTTPGLQAAVTKLEKDIHLSQPWYHKNMGRNQAANVLNGLGNKDGVFLIRESKSKCGSYVLTFKCSGKIVHTPIATQMDPVNDQVCFTLDNGVTKFYDLLQLVEFYQLNAGSLPTRLMHYVVQVPVAE